MPEEKTPPTFTPRHDLELLQGAIDIHVHNGPDIYPRIQDHVELAQAAKHAGFRSICLKCHNFPTVQLAIVARREVQDFDVFSSLVCNHHVGGINPIAVEAAIKYGARQIFMPTVDAENHARLAHHVGQHGKGLMVKGGLSKYTTEAPRISLIDADNKLSREMHEVIDLITDADVILNFGHTSFKEICVVAEAAKKRGAKRMIVDHPFWAKISTTEQQSLSEHGIYINYTVGELLPRWWRVSIDSFADGIRQVGVRKMVISSDCGQLHNPLQVEGMRMVCQLLVEEGFNFDDIRQMIQKNPSELIYE